MRWSKEEDNILTESYQLKKEEILKLLPNRSPVAINIRACNLGLKKEKNEYVEGDISVLLEENLESYYWIGFILADGYIGKNRLKVSISVKDENHLIKLANFIKCKNIIKRFQKSNFSDKTHEYIEFSIQDKFYMPKICEKFDIKPIKTYNPPETYIEDFDKFMALFIGYIDGDGSIKKRKNLKVSQIGIQVHSSWIKFLDNFCLKVSSHLGIKYKKTSRINKRGYAFLAITNSKIYKFLKIFAKNNNLPILDRKWNNIDEFHIGCAEQGENNKKIVLDLLKSGFSAKEILEKTDLTEHNIYRIIRNYKKNGGVCE